MIRTADLERKTVGARGSDGSLDRNMAETRFAEEERIK
jgi:hypothetical protein